VTPDLTRVTHWAGQQIARSALRRALAVLDAAFIAALPVKGVITTPLLYADEADREISDVDIRVRSADRDRAMGALSAAGLPLLHTSKQWGTFETEIDGVPIEFETSVGPPGLCGLSVDAMIAHATRAVEPLGFPHWRAELHEHALLLCVNVFKDKLARALPHSLEDLRRIVRLPEFRDAEFVRVVRAARSTTLVWLVADFLVGQGDARWAEIRDAVGPPPRRAYAETYQLLVKRRLYGRFLLPLLARMGSDSGLERARAVALGGAGTAAWWLRRYRR
jgi:Uncharacterised nucleotidyltransferase